MFGLTGFMGYTLDPIISHYLSLPNGVSIFNLFTSLLQRLGFASSSD